MCTRSNSRPSHGQSLPHLFADSFILSHSSTTAQAPHAHSFSLPVNAISRGTVVLWPTTGSAGSGSDRILDPKRVPHPLILVPDNQPTDQPVMTSSRLTFRRVITGKHRPSQFESKLHCVSRLVFVALSIVLRGDCTFHWDRFESLSMSIDIPSYLYPLIFIDYSPLGLVSLSLSFLCRLSLNCMVSNSVNETFTHLST